jgi:hypothetical protein
LFHDPANGIVERVHRHINEIPGARFQPAQVNGTIDGQFAKLFKRTMICELIRVQKEIRKMKAMGEE